MPRHALRFIGITLMLAAASTSFSAVTAAVASAPGRAITSSSAAPEITGFSPSNGPRSGGALITIVGANFPTSASASLTCTFDGSQIACSYATSTAIWFAPPAGTGAHSVQVVVDGAPSNVATYRYQRPVVSGLSQVAGPATGGNLITIYGDNFLPAPAVTIDGTAAPLAYPPSMEQLVCIAAPHAAGTTNLSVTSAGESSDATSYEYLGAPVISSVTPAHGPIAGGTRITIRGQNFGPSFQGPSASVTVNFHPATGLVLLTGAIVCDTPPSGIAGPVDVTVTIAASRTPHREDSPTMERRAWTTSRSPSPWRRTNPTPSRA